MKKCISLASLVSALILAGCSASTITVPRYVLSYGVSDYFPLGDGDDYDDDLGSPAVDAQAMRDLLVSQGYSDHYSDAHIGARTDSEVTKSNIRDDIVLGLAGVESEAIIVIFYSSHGTYYAPGFEPGYEGAYLVPYDAVDASGYITSATETSLISPQELSSWIAQSGKRNVIVIVNTCFSGGFANPGSSIDIAPQNYGPNDWGTTPAAGWTALSKLGDLLSRNGSGSGGSGPIVISACGTNESTYESPSFFDGHGVLPYFILEAASRGDANGDGFVSATEAYAYAVSQIKINWNIFYASIYDDTADMYVDFMPHISGGARDLVLFSN